jgi:hypothetical protein
MRHMYAVVTIAVISMCAACGNVEADFTLARESRLPCWFSAVGRQLPNDAVVKLIEYTDGSARMTLYRQASVNVFGVHGTKQSEVVGDLRWHPATLAKQNNSGALDENSYPHYMIMSVGKVFEVLEFKQMGPVFYVTDDPKVKSAFGHETETPCR